MNALIETLNLWGDRSMSFALSMLVQSSVLMALLFLIDLAIRRRVRSVVRYGLWLLLLIKLILPPSLALPTGIGYWLSPKRPSPSPKITDLPAVVRISDAPTAIAQSIGRLSRPEITRIHYPAILILLWLTGWAALLALVVHRSRTVRRDIAAAREASDEQNKLLDECRHQIGLRRIVELRVSRESISPAVCGLWKPVIMIPDHLVGRLSNPQLRGVLLHELAHIKQNDVWLNHAQALLQIFYWWHPLLWPANAHIRRVREQAVDEMVMVTLADAAETYPTTLLEVARLALARPRLSLGLIGIVESRSALRERISRLIDRAAPRSARLGVAGGFTVALAAALLLPMAHGQTNGTRNTTATSATPAVTSSPSLLDNKGRVPLLVTVSRKSPRISLGRDPVTTEKLREELTRAVEKDSSVSLSLRADSDVAFDDLLQVLDIAKNAGIRSVALASEVSTSESPAPPIASGSDVKQLLTRTFKLNPTTFGEALRKQFPETAGTNLVRAYFKSIGFPTESPTRLIFYNYGTGMLLVRAEEEELNLVQASIDLLMPPPAQLTLETRFLEIPITAARKLGLNLPTDGTTNTWSRVLTEPETRTLLEAVARSDNVDLLSAPKVTTLSGRQAQIQVVELKTIITGVNPQALTAPGVQSSNGTAPATLLTSLVQVGPQLDIVAAVGADGRTIQLEATHSLTEFLGYDAPPDGGMKVWVDGKEVRTVTPLPRLRTRRMEINAAVLDGQTLVVGNPVQSIASTNPDGESQTMTGPEDSAKRLLVLITPTLIDPAGNRIHPPENESPPPGTVRH